MDYLIEGFQTEEDVVNTLKALDSTTIRWQEGEKPSEFNPFDQARERGTDDHSFAWTNSPEQGGFLLNIKRDIMSASTKDIASENDDYEGRERKNFQEIIG